MIISIPLSIPTISIGGSKKEPLLRDICAAREKLYEAIEALRKTDPHPRREAGPGVRRTGTVVHGDTRRQPGLRH